MYYPRHTNTISLWLATVYFKETQIEFSKLWFLSLKVVLILTILANNVDPDKMQLYAAFHLGLHCLPKYLFIVSSIQRFNQEHAFVKTTYHPVVFPPLPLIFQLFWFYLLSQIHILQKRNKIQIWLITWFLLLTLFRRIEFSIWLNTIKLRMSIVYCLGVKGLKFKKKLYFFLRHAGLGLNCGKL